MIEGIIVMMGSLNVAASLSLTRSAHHIHELVLCLFFVVLSIVMTIAGVMVEYGNNMLIAQFIMLLFVLSMHSRDKKDKS
ncbi:hypothetical protein ZPAH1_orf00113 [Aeromonas phage ZPAH1]|nr:hypothetical protein ZPAH1_orf00113 [Aeromonas phage ZPAH1]